MPFVVLVGANEPSAISPRVGALPILIAVFEFTRIFVAAIGSSAECESSHAIWLPVFPAACVFVFISERDGANAAEHTIIKFTNILGSFGKAYSSLTVPIPIFEFADVLIIRQIRMVVWQRVSTEAVIPKNALVTLTQRQFAMRLSMLNRHLSLEFLRTIVSAPGQTANNENHRSHSLAGTDTRHLLTSQGMGK